MKKKAVLALAFSAALAVSANAQQDIKIYIDDTELDFSAYDDVFPYIENSRVMVPVRAVAEGLGARVDWDPDDETVTIDDDIILTINSKEAIVGDKTEELDSPAVIRDSRTFVPLRFVSENMGANVEWDNDERAVIIDTETADDPEKGAETIDVNAANAELNNAVYLGVADYGTRSSDIKDYFMHRFFYNGAEVEYPIAKTDDYALQNKLQEGGIYNIKVENSIVTAVDRAVATTGIVEEIDDDTFTLKDSKRVFQKPAVYSVKTSAGRVSVAETEPQKGKTISVYSTQTAYITDPSAEFTPVVKAVPGQKTIKNFLASAMEPAGNVLYVYGGGWNWQDDGSSRQAVTIGVPREWTDFFANNDEDYTYRTEDAKNTYYPHMGFNQYYFDGADCSGYVGWAIYNTLNTADGRKGYVVPSTKMAKMLAQDNGFGTWTQDIHRDEFRPGDIMSMNGHVWIYVGGCDDGSAVILHSTPSKSVSGQPGGGIQLSALGDTDSKAYALCEKYMKLLSPQWCERYNVIAVNFNSYTSFEGDTAGRFTWSDTTLSDPDGYAGKDAEAVLSDLFGSVTAE